MPLGTGALGILAALCVLLSRGLCGEAGSESRAAPQAAFSGDDDSFPIEEPQQTDGLPVVMGGMAKAAAEHSAQEGGAVPSAAIVDELKSWRRRDEVALDRLQTLMKTLRLSEAHELLEEAAALRSKQPIKAMTLLSALVDAANSSRVPRANSTAAALELGHMHLRGEGVDLNVAVAVAYYQRAADEGCPEAQHALGVLYSTGYGVPRDPPLAATYLHFAAEGGSIGAQLTMGYRYLLGISAPKQVRVVPSATDLPTH
jgi:TPR repeat protein